MPANFTALLSTPSEAEKALAKESSRQLAPLIQTERPSTSISVLEDELGQKIVVPNVAISLLLEILTQMAQGNAVTLMPYHAELTTQQSADLLNVSRPFLVKLLESGELAHRMVGKHRRVLLQDVMKYKENIDRLGGALRVRARNETLNELVAQAQELKMGYE
jgi:excisionase family DNA binding protein